MKYGLIIGAILASAITGCSQRDGTAILVEKLSVVASNSPGELIAGVPSDIAGKPVSAHDTASVDEVNNQKMNSDLRWYLKQGDVAVITGWTFVKPAEDVVSKVYIELASPDSRYYAIVSSRLARPDVAKTYELSSDQVGYQLSIKTDCMAAGAYRIAVLQVSASGVLRWESPARIIVDENEVSR